MDVSIIIVAWNVRELLYNCLKSVYEQTRGIEFEVIYVDNASKDGSVEMVRKEFPEVKILENETNEGFIGANNRGIKVAKGRYVLLLNSDTLILDNAIAKIVKFADSHPRAAVVGCRVLNPDRTLQRTCFKYPSALNMFLSSTYLYKVFPRSKFFGRERMTWWDFNYEREVDTVCGCFSLVRRKAIEQIGLMDKRYFVYGDDPDWCFRFRKKGWKIIFTPEAEIIHYGGQTTKRMVDEFKLQLFGSKLIFVKLHSNFLEFYLACFFTGIFFLLRSPYWFSVAIFSKNNRANAFCTAKVYFVGGFYCLIDWRRLLMNRQTIGGQL
jgi:GT2 family glycosyltransferase